MCIVCSQPRICRALDSKGVPEGQNRRQVHYTHQFSKSLNHTCDEGAINGLIHTEKERHKVPRLSGPEEQPQLAPQPVLLPLKQRLMT